MAISLSNRYGFRANSPDGNYPSGSFQNESIEGADDGTPLEISWANDKEGFFQGALLKTGRTPNNINDTAPYSQYLNAMTEIARANSTPPTATKYDVCSGYRDMQWSDPNAANNYIDTTLTITDSCMSWDPFYERPVIMLCNPTNIYRIDNSVTEPSPGCWDYTQPLTADPIYINLGTLNAICSICSDAEYLYVAHISSGTLRLSKFRLSNWTGLPLVTVDTSIPQASVNAYFTTLIDASPTRIGMLVGTSGQYVYWQVASIAKSNLSYQLGQGNTPASADTQMSGNMARIVSDGTRLFWTAYNNSNDDRYILSAYLSDPTSSAHPVPTLVLPSYTLTGITYACGAVVVSSNTNKLWAYWPADESFGHSSTDYTYQLEDPTPYVSVPGSILGFDGMSMWNANYYATSGSVRLGIRGVPIQSFSSRVNGFNVGISPPVSYSSVSNPVTSNVPGKIYHDKQDLWFVGADGHVMRFCQPCLRR
jgi:hypothetical protein